MAPPSQPQCLTRAALRAGIFHLSLNAATVAVGALLLQPLVSPATRMRGGVQRPIANAPVIFNVAGVFVVIFARSPIARARKKFVPSRKQT